MTTPPVPLGRWLAGRDEKGRARAASHLDALGPSAASDALFEAWRMSVGKSVCSGVSLFCIIFCTMFVALLVSDALFDDLTGWRRVLSTTAFYGPAALMLLGHQAQAARSATDALARELCRRDPPRGLEPLLQTWLKTPDKATPRAREDARALTPLLARQLHGPHGGRPDEHTRGLVRDGLLAAFAPRRRRRRVPADLSPETADLWATLAQMLGHTGHPDDADALRRLAGSVAPIARVPDAAPNRALVHDAVTAFAAPADAPLTLTNGNRP